ncbi:MAG: inositol monophosphatase family protein, partial [Elusimicrobiota bacterium]|nr:inositol monophosphatase family protein [Elusimicrobiota bacterium]
MHEIKKRLEAAQELALGAGSLLKSGFGKTVEFKKKADGSLVSTADLAAEKLIIDGLKKRFPSDSILSEESGRSECEDEFLWIIDPLDGTHNYIKGLDIFGTSIGLCREGVPAAGVICMPMTNELFYARKGGGAFLNGEKISVSKRPMKEATMFFDSSIARVPKRNFAALERLHDKVFNIRMLGSTVAGLCHIAAGRAEFEVEFCDVIWDFAAGLLIVEEAGGAATELDGA